MKTCSNWLKPCLLLAASFLSPGGHAEDIDIFSGTTEVNTSLPNVIFVLDNTSNWSRESQKWPENEVQGQSEISAIKTALAAQTGKLNVGIIEYETESGGGDGGYVRFDLQELTATSQTSLNAVLDRIYNNINDPTEKRNSANPYADLPWDFYNYLSGSAHSASGSKTPASLADPDAYSSQWSQFQSPLGAADACADTYMIYIGNNVNGNIAADDATNTNALKALYAAIGEEVPDALAGDGGTPLRMPGFTGVTVTEEAETIPEQIIPDEIIPGYWIEGESTPDVTIPAGSGISAACYTTTQAEACTLAESTGNNLCAGKANCSCTVHNTGERNGCRTNGADWKQTYHFDVEWKEEIIPGVETEREWVEPVTIPGYTIPEQVIPGGEYEIYEASGEYDTSGGLSYNFDDWTKFMFNYGIPLDVTVDGKSYSQRVKVVTYTIDVFNKQQSEALSGVWFSAAENGGGRYFQARSKSAILSAINTALGDILSVSSSFAAVSLPLSATNRARVDNQVYIGMFRPAPGKAPRWFGNLKRYQLAMFDGIPRLADVNLQSAINPLTGFATACSESFWSTDTGTYWESLAVNPAPYGECNDVDNAYSGWSDLPDGPFVEKGGVAQKTRELSDASTRKIYTPSSDTDLRALADTDAAALGGQVILDYLQGDQAGTGEIMPGSGLRASIHADVIHSRPLSIRHGVDDVTLYYGANDGIFRAIDADDGSERWAMVVPEHYAKIERLFDNAPLIKYTGADEEAGYEYDLKDYFFDGPTGQITIYDANNDLELAYIYPTMRRGGRMLYALDVTDPDTAPDLLWRAGCPNLDDNVGCTSASFNDIGQTWSMPIGGYAEGYKDGDDNPKLIIAFGGGFDDCLNEDVAVYPSGCSSANGKGVYVVDAAAGTLLAHLPTDAPVITELSPIDIDFDGHLDFAYAADVAGNLYRVNFATLGSDDPDQGLTALPADEWSIYKIGSVADNERRFYNAPTAAAFQGTVIVAIGTGDRERPLEVNYPYVAEVQNRFYALIDSPYKTFVANPVGELATDESTTVNLDGDTMYAVVAAQAEAGDGEEVEERAVNEFDGWYMDLTDRGEQIANASAIAGGKVFFNTFQPGGASNGLCTKPLGISTAYSVNLFSPDYTTGTEIAGGGMPIPPVIATVKIPPGLPNCDGLDCPTPADDPCATGECEVKTVCIGCEGFEPVEIVPVAPPIRQRIYFTEDIDRNQ